MAPKEFGTKDSVRGNGKYRFGRDSENLYWISFDRAKKTPSDNPAAAKRIPEKPIFTRAIGKLIDRTKKAA